MRRPPAVPPELLALLERQDGVVTNAQAHAAGLTIRQIRTLLRFGWTRPIRGVLVAPNPRDPFRSSVRAALLACPGAVVAGLTAARLHKLEGLPRWTAAEEPELLLAAGRTYEARSGIRLRSGLRKGEGIHRAGFPITSLARTVRDMALVLEFDNLICLLDSALRARWRPIRSSHPGQVKLRLALALADGRSESTFETLLRLLFVRAGIPPETLQFRAYNGRGHQIARVDMAWSSLKLAIEADGRETHDAVPAVYRDRIRGNALEQEGWTVLRFTWADLKGRPDEIIDEVRRAVNRLAAAKSAS